MDWALLSVRREGCGRPELADVDECGGSLLPVVYLKSDWLSRPPTLSRARREFGRGGEAGSGTSGRIGPSVEGLKLQLRLVSLASCRRWKRGWNWGYKRAESSGSTEKGPG